MKRTLLSLGATLVLALASASAQPFRLPEPELRQRLSPDEARDEARAGRQLPLAALLPRIRSQIGDGQVLATELEARGSRRVYVLRWKSSERLMDIEVDAATGEVLEAR